MDVSGEFWTRFDSWAGPTFGTALLCVGFFLMFKGATKIKDFVISNWVCNRPIEQHISIR